MSPAADVLVQVQSSGGEELESMNIECAQELNAGGTQAKPSVLRCDRKITKSTMLHELFMKRITFAFCFFTKISERQKLPSSHAALRRPGWVTHKGLLAAPTCSQTAGGSPGPAHFCWHVRLTAPDRESWQLRVPPAGLVGADGTRRRGLPALRTLPRLRRHSGGAERRRGVDRSGLWPAPSASTAAHKWSQPPGQRGEFGSDMLSLQNSVAFWEICS